MRSGRPVPHLYRGPARPLNKSQIHDITRIQLRGLKNRLADTEIGLHLDESAITFLVEAGYDPVYGARPLKRAIQRYLENPLAQALLSGRYMRGQCISVSDVNGELQFKAS